MRKAVYICLIALLLSACANNAPTETVEAPAVNQTTVQTTPIGSTTSSAKEEKSVETSTTTVAMTSSLTTKSISSVSRTKDNSVDKYATETETVTSQTEASLPDKIEPSVTTSVSVSESKPKVTAVSSVPKIDVTQGTTTTKTPSSTTKKDSTTTTTAKPKQSTTTTEKPKATTTTTTEAEIEYVEIEDVTCLATMVENLKETDTPPSYYEKTGKSLKHDGTDYGKAAAVYKWMRNNGWGSCVYYSMETFFVCKGAGLECAYAFATDNGWYGHTYSVVKVNGIWYVLDTQGRSFLENSEYCTRMFDGNDKDMTPFKEDIWYDYDENGEYRDWTIS